MAKLPLDPRYAKAVVESERTYGCAGPMLSLAAMLSIDGATFIVPGSPQDLADEVRGCFTNFTGDTITLINVLAAFGSRKAGAANQWCEQHFVNRRAVESARQVREQLVKSCKRLGLLGEGYAASELAAARDVQHLEQRGLPMLDENVSTCVRRCLTSACFANTAQRQPSGEYLAVASRELVTIHPSSALFARRASCVLFHELVFTTKLYMRGLTQIEPGWLAEVAPNIYQYSP